jgi:hypothetical protein
VDFVTIALNACIIYFPYIRDMCVLRVLSKKQETNKMKLDIFSSILKSCNLTFVLSILCECLCIWILVCKLNPNSYQT